MKQTTALSAAAAVDDDAADRLFREHFAQASFIVNRYLIDHMRRLVREVDSDFDQIYLWGLIYHVQIMRGLFERLPTCPAPASPFERMFLTAKGIKLSELTQLSGLPRESVRRKLMELEAKGRIARAANGGWTLNTSNIDHELVAFTHDNIRRFVAASNELRHLIGSTDRRSPKNDRSAHA